MVKILFLQDGNSSAVLVINKAGRRRRRTLQFDCSEVALAWCRRHRAVLVFTPSGATPPPAEWN
jgi:hypothetical protein